MIPVTPADVVEWAAACNNRALYRDTPGPTDLADGGPGRLFDLAEGFTAAPPDLKTEDGRREYVRRLGRLAAGLRGDVFRSCGAETARSLVLCLLAAALFHPAQAPDLERLLDLIEAGDAAAVADLLLAAYPPAP
jgi:hypothetical protein